MNISRTKVAANAAPRVANVSRTEAAAQYSEAKDNFQKSRDAQSKTLSRFDTIGGVTGGLAGLGTMIAGVAITDKIAGGITQWPLLLPAVAGAVAVGYGLYSVISKIGERSASKSDFLETHKAFAQTRDNYRESLLAELNDEGVSELSEARWGKLKNLEDLSSQRPSTNTNDMMSEVENLAFLADSRLQTGWKGELARLQDDPMNFARELQVVSKYGGIQQALISGHGESR